MVAPDVTPARIDTFSTDGPGTPSLVFTHGWANDRTAWDGLIAALGGDRPCHTWSLRGHGASEVTPVGTYTRDHALADFDSVLDAAVGPAVLVGHSLGGYLSLAQALRRPDDIAGLVLVGAGPGFRKEEARVQWNANVTTQAASLGVPEGSEVISMHFDSWVLDEIATITVPVLVVLGERDKAFAASASVFEKNLDVRQTVVVPGAGHNVHKSHAEPVAEAISSFLSNL